VGMNFSIKFGNIVKKTMCLKQIKDKFFASPFFIKVVFFIDLGGAVKPRVISFLSRKMV
jgi:hypothetical protein